MEVEDMHQCSICETNQTEGIFVYHVFICPSCEVSIIQTEPEDPNYRFFVNKLKRLQQQTLNS